VQRSDLDIALGAASRGSSILAASLGLLLARGDGVVVEVSTSAVGSQMGVVDSGVQRDRGRRADVLVRVLEDERLELLCLPLALIEDAVIVNRPSRSLDAG
jgi:hypothetical protein